MILALGAKGREFVSLLTPFYTSTNDHIPQQKDTLPQKDYTTSKGHTTSKRLHDLKTTTLPQNDTHYLTTTTSQIATLSPKDDTTPPQTHTSKSPEHCICASDQNKWC